MDPTPILKTPDDRTPMFISNTHRAIFVHIPKTAGTSITNLVEPELRWNDVVLGGSTFGERVQLAYRDRFGLFKHSPARAIRNVIGEELWKAYFTFAVVRHPYTRIASFYNWTRDAVERASPDAQVWKWPATEAFLKTGSFSEFIRHEQFRSSRAGKPQVDWVCDDDGRCILDLVGRFEELPACIETIASRLGLGPVRLGRHNESSSDEPPAGHFRDEDDYRYLHELHRRDFEQFGYDPGLRL